VIECNHESAGSFYLSGCSLNTFIKFYQISANSLQSSMGFCVLDDKRNQLISGGKDGTLVVWTADGQVILMLFLQCCLDMATY